LSSLYPSLAAQPEQLVDHFFLSTVDSFGGYMMWALCLLNGEKPWLASVPCNHLSWLITSALGAGYEDDEPFLLYPHSYKNL
jgi:hypothetical protein